MALVFGRLFLALIFALCFVAVIAPRVAPAADMTVVLDQAKGSADQLSCGRDCPTRSSASIPDPGRHGIGSAVVALIFSMAKREVTFLSGTAAISFL